MSHECIISLVELPEGTGVSFLLRENGSNERLDGHAASGHTIRHCSREHTDDVRDKNVNYTIPRGVSGVGDWHVRLRPAEAAASSSRSL